jgi:hypothetical protein
MIYPSLYLEDMGIEIESVVEKRELIKIFENKFKGLFSSVEGVWITYDKNCNYFYFVEGENEGSYNYEFFKIESIDVINQTYTYMNLDSKNINEETIYCKDYSLFPGCPVTSCSYGYNCKGAICGTVDQTTGECQIE